MSEELVIVWSGDAPALRAAPAPPRDPGERGYSPVVREGDTVGVRVDDARRYVGGATLWAAETIKLLVDVAREAAPGVTLTADDAQWALREHRWSREALREALLDRLRGLDKLSFAQFFERVFGAPPPFEVPADYKVLSAMDLRGKTVEAMIGSGVGEALLVQADVGAAGSMPVGWFQAGFWGHGINSYAVYYGRSTARSRVFLRLPYGDGVYEAEPEKVRARALATLKKYIELAGSLPCRHVTLVESMGAVHWRIERLDGTVAEMQHERDSDPSSLDAFDFEAIARGATSS